MISILSENLFPTCVFGIMLLFMLAPPVIPIKLTLFPANTRSINSTEQLTSSEESSGVMNPSLQGSPVPLFLRNTLGTGEASLMDIYSGSGERHSDLTKQLFDVSHSALSAGDNLESTDASGVAIFPFSGGGGPNLTRSPLNGYSSASAPWNVLETKEDP